MNKNNIEQLKIKLWEMREWVRDFERLINTIEFEDTKNKCIDKLCKDLKDNVSFKSTNINNINWNKN